MTSKNTLLLLFSTLAILSIAKAQGRAPHGLAAENPMALSPLAYDFFNPTSENSNTKNPCGASSCSPLPLAAKVAATQAQDNLMSTPTSKTRSIGAGGIVGIMFGLAFLVLLVFVARRTNTSRAMSVQPDA